MNWKRLSAFTLLLGLGLATGWPQDVKLVFVSPGPGHPMYDVARKVLPEAAKAIDCSVAFVDVPPNRASSMFDSSEVDGFLFSDDEFLNQHPSAVKVDIPLGYDEIVVLTHKLSFKPESWASLRPYRIGYMYGMAIVERNTRGMRIDGAHSPSQAFDKLMAGRTDVAVFPRFLYDAFKNRYPDIKILEPPIERVALYAFMTAKRADVVRELAISLSEMKRKGRIQAITAEVASGLR